MSWMTSNFRGWSLSGVWISLRSGLAICSLLGGIVLVFRFFNNGDGDLGFFSSLLGVCSSFLFNDGCSFLLSRDGCSFLFSGDGCSFLFSGPGIVSSLFLIGHWLELNRYLIIEAFGILRGDLNIEDLVLTNVTLEIVYVGLETSHDKSWWCVQSAGVTFSFTI